MRLTESQIKSIILSELKNADGLERLDEFKAIFKALTAVFKSIGSAIATAFSAAMADVDEGGYKAVYNNKTPGKSEKALSPKTDPYDQVYTIGRVLFFVDAGIEFAIIDMERAVETMKELNFPVEAEDTAFSETLNAAAENVSTASGVFAGYLSKAPSSKISSVGAALKPGTMLTEMLKNLAEAVSEIESIDPIADWEKIEKSEAVQNVVGGETENAEELKNLINEINGNYTKNIEKLSELKSLIDEANDLAMQAEQVMDVAAEEEGALPEESDLIDHKMYVLRDLISEIIR